MANVANVDQKLASSRFAARSDNIAIFSSIHQSQTTRLLIQHVARFASYSIQNLYAQQKLLHTPPTTHKPLHPFLTPPYTATLPMPETTILFSLPLHNSYPCHHPLPHSYTNFLCLHYPQQIPLHNQISVQNFFLKLQHTHTHTHTHSEHTHAHTHTAHSTHTAHTPSQPYALTPRQNINRCSGCFERCDCCCCARDVCCCVRVYPSWSGDGDDDD